MASVGVVVDPPFFDDLARLLEIGEQVFDAYGNRCYVRAIAGRDLPLALADCNEALRLKPNEADTMNSRTFCASASAAPTMPLPITTQR